MLSNTEKAVVETIRMRLTTQQALQYLQDNGFPVSRATYFRHKRRVEEKKLERVYHIAKLGFVDQHLQRIDGLEIIEKMMWQEYYREHDPFKRVQILKDIAQVQPYLSAYYESTKYVVDETSNKIGFKREQSILDHNQKNNTSLNPIHGKENQVSENNPGKSITEREEKLKKAEDYFKKSMENFVF
jgi:hypothetical protein